MSASQDPKDKPGGVYRPADVNPDYEHNRADPGAYPYARGIHASMYRERLWTMRQYAGFGTAQETNARLRMLQAQGQTGLSVAFDLPTQMGRDSDDPLALGEVGKVGVAIDSIDDMAVLLNGLKLDQVSTSMTINSTAGILLALYASIGERDGVPTNKLRGTVQNDLLKEYVARGTYVYPIRPSLRLTRDIMVWCHRNAPHFNPISVSGYHMREAGCTAEQEIAFTLAHGITYVETAIAGGLSADEVGRGLSFFFNAHNGFIEEVAKFRAARKLWAEIMKTRFGAKDPKAMQLRFHAQTGGSTLQAQQPLNNVVRTTVQALAAILGGCQSLHTNSYDEALALPTEASALLALRTQQLLAYETNVTEYPDALGGAYALEHKTDELETQARSYLRDIDERGGTVAAIEAGYIQDQIAESAYRYQLKIENQEQVVVGVNRFQSSTSEPIALHRHRAELEQEQREKLALFKKSRPQGAVHACDALKKAATNEQENLMPHIIAAVRANATLGEISNALRDVFGVYQAS